jgi:uncharacterized membrane protein
MSVIVAQDYNKILRIHGGMMFVAWFILPIVGIYIARFFRKRNWFPVHLTMMILTLLLTVSSFILIVLHRPYPHFSSYDKLNNSHTKIGLTVFIGLIIQVILGSIAHTIRKTNVIHKLLGRLLVILALINVIIGMFVYSSFGNISKGYFISIYILLGIIISIFMVSECAINRN